MTDHLDTVAARADDEFERLGRQAGAELRTPPPADGHRIVQRTANRRRVTVATIAAGATAAIVVTGLLVANHSPQAEQQQPVATTPPPASIVTTTDLTDLSDNSLPIAVRTTTPGTWRAVPDSPVASELLSPSGVRHLTAVWTGNEAVLIGANDAADPPLLALAYDVGRDQWRQLANPPSVLDSLSGESPAARWTGSEVLTSTNQGEVFAYDPVEDRWEARAPADESLSLAASDSRVAVSARGVLMRTSEGWWWYENSTDRWESLAAPALGVDYSTLAALDQDTMVATQVDGQTITSAVLDIETRTWRNGPAVVGPYPVRGGDAVCDAIDGLLACYIETYGGLDGIVFDPLIGFGSLQTFALGNHSNSLTIEGIPWVTHAWKLLSPQSATWEDLPGLPPSVSYLGDVNGFDAAVWTGSEIVFFAGRKDGGRQLVMSAAYTPLQLPGP